MANIPQWKVGDVLSASKLNAMVDAINNLLAEQKVDVSNFITTEQLTTILEGYSDVGHTHTIAEIVDLVLPTVPTKTSQLQNDSDFATNASVDEKIASAATGGQVDLTSYAKKTDLPTKTSQLTNDSDFATNTSVDEKIANISTGGIVPVTQVEPAELDVPRLYFYGNALPTTKDNVNLEMDYKSNTMKFHSYVKLKCQGTSSMSYPKKNFTVTLYEDSARSTKLKKNFKGWGAQNKFCLKANWVDSTHTRNISGARIAYDMVASRPDSPFKQELLKCPRNGAVDGFPIKVYFNGEFWGIYTFNIPKDAWMFNMNEDNPNHIVLCAERNTDGNSSLINSCQFRKLWDGVDGGDWSYEVGTPSDTVKNSLNRCISFVMNASDEEFHDNISQYFDLYSLLDYYCFSYVVCHLDGLAKNMLLATYDGTIWGACLYDMDSIYGVQWNGASFVSPQYKCPEQYQEQFSRLWVRIEECFADELRARYAELRQEALSLTNIIGHVEEIYDLLSPNMKTDETTKWANIPQYNANTITRFRNYMKDRVKYTDAEVALIGVFIACESIKLNKTELKMGIFSSEGEDGSTDDSNVNYVADAQWQAGSLNDDGSLNTTDSNALNDKYCILENLPIGEYTLHHDTFGYKKLCIRAYDGEDGQNILIGSNMASLNNTNDVIFKISCPDTKVYISVFPNGSQDLSGVTLKRRDLTTSIQDKAYSVNTISQPGWADLGDKNNYLLIELKLGSTTEISDVTEIQTVSIGNDVYNVAWSRNGVNGGSHLEQFPSKCATNTAYAGNWYVLLSVPAAKYGKTVAEFKQYCSSNGIENIIVNSIESMSGNTTATTTPIETTWVAGYIKRNVGAVNDGTAGTIGTSDVDASTDFIAVQPGDIIEIQTNLPLALAKSFGCVGYDSDKNFVKVYATNSNGTGVWTPEGISVDYSSTSLRVDSIPEGVAYVRICIAVTPNNIASTITSLTLTHYDSTGGNKQLLTYTLRATLTPANTMDKVVWSVEPAGICRVSNGKVTAVANGDCIITATCGQHSATCNVNVSGITTDGNLLTGINWESGTISNSGQLQTSTLDYRTELFELPEGCYRFSSSNIWKKAVKYSSDGNFIVQDIYDKAGNTNDIVFHSNNNTKFRLIANGEITDATVTKLEGNATKSKTYTGADIIQLTPSYSNANYVGVEVNFDGITSLDTFRGFSYTGKDDIYTGTYSIYEGKLYFNLFISKSIASGLAAVQEYFNANPLQITFHYTN